MPRNASDQAEASGGPVFRNVFPDPPEGVAGMPVTLLAMVCRWAPWLLALALAAGCGSSASLVATDDVLIKQELLGGVGRIRAMHDRHKLNAELARILARLGRARGSAKAARQARVLAIQGFELTMEGTRSQLDFSENDSGEVAAATRDAKRADRYLTLGANRLRAAGQALGVQIGKLNQH